MAGIFNLKLLSVLTFFFFFWPHAAWHVGSKRSDQGLNLCSLKWNQGASPLDFQGIPYIDFYFYSFTLNFHSFVYFWPHWVLIALCDLSLFSLSGPYSLVVVPGLLTVVTSCGGARL